MFGLRVRVSTAICLAAITTVGTAATAHAMPAPIPGSGPQHEAELTDSTLSQYAGYGGSTAISGNTLAVGVLSAAGGHGAVYLYTKPKGGWTTGMTPSAILTDQTGQADGFGSAVAFSGDTLVVGAPSASQMSTTYAGAAFVFVKPASGWATTSSATSELYASDYAANNSFGDSVAIAGDTVVVGATQAGGGGAAYVYVKPGAGWQPTMTESGKLTGTFSDADDLFGDSVAISGDTILVTAPHHKNGSALQVGLGYVFVKPPGGWSNMTQTRKLEPSDAKANEDFGSYHSSSISGSTISIGSSIAEVYVFSEPAGGWGAGTSVLTETAKFTPFGAPAGSVVRTSITGTNIAIGDGAPSRSGVADAGLAWVYSEPTAGWGNPTAFPVIIGASNDQTDDEFGDTTPVMDGNTLVVGAGYADDQRGAVYLYTPAAPTLSKVTQQKTSWRLGGAGTAFHLKLDEAATVKFAFAYKHKGKFKKAGTITKSEPVGKASLPFAGKIAKGKQLPAGKCRVVIAAANANGVSKSVTLKFTVEPKKKPKHKKH